MRTLSLLTLLAVLALCVAPACGGSQTPEPDPEPAPGPGPGPGPTPGPAPGPGPTPGVRCQGAPPAPDYVCMEDCGPPVSTGNEPPPGWSWLSPEHAESRRLHGCPICLPAAARIATPSGDVAVSQLADGDVVWSRDCDGARIATRLLAVRSVPAPPGHHLVRATLADGRVVHASPRHPLSDRRMLASLRSGELLDGARVEHVERIPYDGARTWDVLPSGPTGDYWADGVLLGSTLVAPSMRCPDR